jgi:hypothetical protein
MFDFPAQIAAEEAHIRKLAALPGWFEYADHKARGMAKKYPALYASLPQVVAQVIKEKTNDVAA